LSANASCKADGKKTYYDKNGNSTLTLNCKRGFLEGESEFHSAWSDPSNWFSDPVKIYYVNGIASGKAIVGSSNYNLTEFLLKDGLVNGKFKRIQTKTAGMAYPYTEGKLVDGLLHGEVKTDTNETEFYDHGKLKWLIDRRGVKEQSFNRCPDRASGESIERFVEKHVTVSKCVWPDKRDRMMDPVKGVVSKLRVLAKNGGYEILTFNNGVMTESRVCSSKDQLSRLRLYGHRLDEKGAISFATMPYFKILDVEVRNGKLHGASQLYQAGTFRESIMYENGTLNEKTRRYGTAAVNCPEIHKAK
jgi:antitoxin component YwqK of YwqJK toxin-antitoxin module